MNISGTVMRCKVRSTKKGAVEHLVEFFDDSAGLCWIKTFADADMKLRGGDRLEGSVGSVVTWVYGNRAYAALVVDSETLQLHEGEKRERSF